jgi:hypothetical protein
MKQDLLIQNYEEEYDDIPYDLVYNDRTKIPTRSTDAQDKNISNNTTQFNCVSETCNCLVSYYHHSKYIVVLLFFGIVLVIGGLYFVIFITTHIR